MMYISLLRHSWAMDTLFQYFDIAKYKLNVTFWYCLIKSDQKQLTGKVNERVS